MAIAQRDHLECSYLGWGEAEMLLSLPLRANEALICTPPSSRRARLIHGFLESLRTAAIRQRIPEHFSENDLVEVMVGMVYALPEALLAEFAQMEALPQAQFVVCAMLRWSLNLVPPLPPPRNSAPP